MIDLIINNKSYINPVNYLKAYTLQITKELDDYSFDFSLIMPLTKAKEIEAGAEVFMKDGENIIIGGIIYDIDYKYLAKDKELNEPLMQLDIKADNFTNLTQRILVKPIDVLEENIDLNKAENIYMNYFDKYLKNYAITLGGIKTNMTVEELEEDEEEKTLKEIFDKLKDITKSEWYIDHKKRFYVYNGKKDFLTHEEILDENSYKFRNIKLSKTLQDYRNRYVLVGGEPSADQVIEDQYIDENGHLRVIVDNVTEQQRMKLLIGGDGIFTLKEQNDKLQSIAEMKRYAEEVLNKFGRPPVSLEFDTFVGNMYEAGDFIRVNLPSLNIQNELFCIDSIEIEDMEGGIATLNYHLKCSLRNSNTSNGNLWDILGKNPGQGGSILTGGGKQNTVFTDTVDVQVQGIIATSTDITFY